MMYYEEPSVTAQKHGPTSDKVTAKNYVKKYTKDFWCENKL